MNYTLTTEELFSDRVELIGYFTSVLSAIFLLVYFGMIFFYQPVQLHSFWTKIGLLASPVAVLIIGLFIPQHKNPARLLCITFFYILLLTSYYLGWEQSKWGYIAVWGYSCFALWVLSHPVAKGFFRKLKPLEIRMLPTANWLSFHLVFLNYYAALLILDGLFRLLETENSYQYDPDMGIFILFSGILLLGLLQFLKRLAPWSRWLIGLISLGVGVAALPDTMDLRVHNYLEYWRALAKVSYFLSLPIYLFFSKNLRAVFRTHPQLPPQPSQDAKP